MLKKKSLKSGFTLIELLLVLSVFGILISLGVIGLRGAQSAERDNNRKNIGSQVDSALQAWFSQNNNYPAASGSTSFIGNATSFITSNSSDVNGNIPLYNGKTIAGNGLTINSTVQQISYSGGTNPCITPPSININTVYMCYLVPGLNSTPYSLFTYLENGTIYQVH